MTVTTTVVEKNSKKVSLFEQFIEQNDTAIFPRKLQKLDIFGIFSTTVVHYLPTTAYPTSGHILASSHSLKKPCVFPAAHS